MSNAQSLAASLKHDRTECLAIVIPGNHGLANQSTVLAQLTPAILRGPTLKHPKIDVRVSIKDWFVFLRHWEVFPEESGIDEASASSQLFQCAGAELDDSLIKANPNHL